MLEAGVSTAKSVKNNINQAEYVFTLSSSALSKHNLPLIFLGCKRLDKTEFN